MKKRTKKGFTLIELIVVIAILAILAIIAIPVVTGIVTDARDAANAANARTIQLAAKAYMTQQDDTDLSGTDLTAALTRMGLTSPIGGKADFKVSSQGAVTITNVGGGTGAISSL